MPTFPAKARAAITCGCVLYRAVCAAQSQNAPAIEIPLTGENSKNEQADIPSESLSISKNKKQKFADYQRAVDEPTQAQINHEKLEMGRTPEGAQQVSTFFDAVSRLKSAEVRRGGGLGAAPMVRFRGARALEPQYFWNGISWTGVFSGEQNTELIPALSLESITAYPDAPPFWYTRNSIAGALDLKSCSALACLTRGFCIKCGGCLTCV